MWYVFETDSSYDSCYMYVSIEMMSMMNGLDTC